MILRQNECSAAGLKAMAFAFAFASLCAPATAETRSQLPLVGADTKTQVADSPAGATDTSPTPDACYIIFPSEESAALHCPAGVKAVVAYDFWKNQPLGWSCDCAHPSTPGEETPASGARLHTVF